VTEVKGSVGFLQVVDTACPGSHLSAIVSLTYRVATLGGEGGSDGGDRADAV